MARKKKSTPKSTRKGTRAKAKPVCPNCGHDEFDEDGDCARCHEPDVARPAARGRRKKDATAASAADQAAKKMSGLDAAARVLAESDGPMSVKAIVAVAAAKGYWQSPGGKTPEATVYSAIIREIAAKGDAARFRKVERGMFASASA